MNQLQEILVHKKSRNIIIIISVILLIILIYKLFFKEKSEKTNPDQEYPIKNNAQAVAIDAHCFYVVGKNYITKYNRETGKKILHRKLPFKNLACAKMVKGDLVVTNGRHKSNTVIWLNPDDLSIIDYMNAPMVHGILTWIDYSWNMWWLCDITKDIHESKIYCFDNQWNLQGFWKLPKKLLKELDPDRPFGGDWIGEYLCITGNQKPYIYIIDLPKEAVHGKYMQKFPIPFDGKGFILEQGKKHLYVWGVQDSPPAIIKGKLEME